ncbi:MAG TPA: Asp-tRNA(Asn)/Glu-tRNA(Gln) amidotransferase subunit GatA [Deltaproteobacteria bacterium]|nr:Asp-tRNA(Asn)/Glu-tRNA(Gln) amidotransferase subunit GatA [Deltaproteobacteria bacterium]
MLETARRYRRGETTPTREIEALLEKIRTDDHNAFITVNAEEALEQAARADRDLNEGNEDILLGVPIAIKDNICTRGLPTTCASRILSNFTPAYDATVVRGLRNRGAVIIGKTNLDEFAMGSTTTSSSIGPSRNPWDRTKTPGGSSGGSAAAVASRLCAGALGSDTGGSVRQPASFCGITGLKPTYGSVSRYGLVAFASSLDQVGPMGRSARDVSVLFDAIRGHDPRDSTSVQGTHSLLTLDGLDMHGIRVGVPKAFFAQGLSEDVEGAVNSAISVMRELGADIVPVDLTTLTYGVAVYYIIACAEASSNLARYDGVRYGLRSSDATELVELYSRTRAEGFNAEVKRRIMLGTYVLSAGYYEAYYLKASQVRTLMVQDFQQAFTRCDLIAGPTAPVTAFGLDEMLDDPLSIYLLDIYTIPASLAGLPAMSIPCGFDRGGLPIGLQLIAPSFREDVLLGAGIAFQDATTFHEVMP